MNASIADSDSLQSCQLQILYLQRLLNCMKNEPSNIGNKKTVEIRKEQMYLARSMLITLDNTLNDCLQSGLDNANKDELIRVVEGLRKDVESTCHLVNSKLTNQNEEHKDTFDHLFTDDSSISDEDENGEKNLGNCDKNEWDDDDDISLDDKSTPTKSNKMNTVPTVDTDLSSRLTPEEEMKEQEENLQNEIANMAAALKQSTKNINLRLSSQNVELDEMGDLVETNVDQTKTVTGKVTDHVKAGWRKSVGRLFIFFIILGSWAFCFLTIRVVPKRPNTCVFFCDNVKRGHTHEQRSARDQSRGEQRKQQKERIITPKYSYCEEDGCTNRLSKEEQTMSMARIDQRGVNAISVAFDLLEEHAEKRKNDRLLYAQQEADDIGVKRVRDGWHEPENTNIKYDIDESSTHRGNDGTVNDSVINNDDQDVDDSIIKKKDREHDFVYDPQDILYAARKGDIHTLSSILHHRPEWVSYRDQNGWGALLEATRSESIEAIRMLVEIGNADVNSRTGEHMNGGSVLWWAEQLSISIDSATFTYLAERGAKVLAPLF